MKRITGLIIIILFSFWTIRPLMTSGYFPMHDDTQVARVIEMGRALREGQFPVRWVSDLGFGYGYPIFNFYGPLPYYTGGFFYALGFTGLGSTKIMMGIGLVAAGITMYLVLSEILGVSSGIIGAALYMYVPYRAVDAYVRGAVGEYFALIFLPLILFGFWRKNVLVGAVGIAGLVLSHTILGYAGMIFVFIALLVVRIQKQYIILAALGLGLSAFFWLPALIEMKYTNVASQISATADFHDHFVCLPQLWNSIWGHGGSAIGCLDGFSFKVGKVHIILALLSLLGAVLKRTNVVFAGVSIFLLSVFFMTPVSVRLWEILPNFSFVQYPWRFLAFAIFGISVAGSGIAVLFRGKVVRIAVVFLCLALVFFVEAKRFEPQYTYGTNVEEMETPRDVRFRASLISHEYLPPDVIRPSKVEDALFDTIQTSDAYELSVEQNTNTYKKFAFLSGQDNTITLKSAYFPGWHYWVNENEVKPRIERGLPVITVPSGFSVVQMRFLNTPIRTLGNVISILAVGMFIYLYERKNKKTIG